MARWTTFDCCCGWWLIITSANNSCSCESACFCILVPQYNFNVVLQLVEFTKLTNFVTQLLLKDVYATLYSTSTRSIPYRGTDTPCTLICWCLSRPPDIKVFPAHPITTHPYHPLTQINIWPTYPLPFNNYPSSVGIVCLLNGIAHLASQEEWKPQAW